MGRNIEPGCRKTRGVPGYPRHYGYPGTRIRITRKFRKPTGFEVGPYESSPTGHTRPGIYTRRNRLDA